EREHRLLVEFLILLPLEVEQVEIGQVIPAGRRNEVGFAFFFLRRLGLELFLFRSERLDDARLHDLRHHRLLGNLRRRLVLDHFRLVIFFIDDFARRRVILRQLHDLRFVIALLAAFRFLRFFDRLFCREHFARYLLFDRRLFFFFHLDGNLG